MVSHGSDTQRELSGQTAEAREYTGAGSVGSGTGAASVSARPGRKRRERSPGPVRRQRPHWAKHDKKRDELKNASPLPPNQMGIKGLAPSRSQTPLNPATEKARLEEVWENPGRPCKRIFG